METPTANTLVSDHIIKALCNTLMHSLWQGILLAILTGAIIIFTKKASAAKRYNLLVGALTLFAGGVLFTFILQLQLQQPQANHASITYHANTTATAPITYPTNAVAPAPVTAQIATPIVTENKKESITQTVLNYFNSHYNIIVLIWFLIICAKSVQMAVGLHGVYYLKRTKVFAVGEAWENRLLQLAKQLRIKQTIRLMESGIAMVPMVIGHLKPVILIPIGLINSLPADAVEAILVHELAHIRRRDYLVNLLQSFMEIIFFFNPAVLWLSQLIKTERENCCDDMALAQSNNKENYIRALVSCEEYKAAGTAYAMAFPGGKNSLLARVKRMIANRNHSLNMFEKTMLAVCLVVLGLGVSAFTVREQIKKTIHSVVAAIHHESKVQPKQAEAVKGDTTKKKPAAPVNDVNALLGQLRQISPDTLLLTGNNQLTLVNYNLDSLLKVNSALPGFPENQGFNANLYLSQLGKADSNQLAKLMTARLNSQLLLEKPDSNILKTLKQTHDIGRELYREHLITDTNHLSITTHLDKRELIVNGVRMPEDVYQRIYTKFYKKGDNGNYSSNTNRNNRFGSDGVKTQRIIGEMLKDGIITSTNDLSFKIGTTEFVVNYKKQPEGIYRKYRAEYVDGQHSGHRDWIWFYKFDTNKWDLMNGHRNNGDTDQPDGSTSGVFQGKEDANSGYNKNAYNDGTSEAYSASAKNYNRWDAYSDSLRKERDRVEVERDKKLIADLLQDGLITDPNNLTFTLSNKGVIINGKKQSDEVYKKYKEKYQPDNTGTGWNWTYSHHE